MSPLLRAVSMTALSFCLTSTLYAATYEVSPSGNDANAGSAAQPWKTLIKAATTVQAGDTVLVNNGTYAGFRMRTSGTAAARITFKSKTKYGAKITSPGPNNDPDLIAILSASYVTIDGFEVSGAPRAGIGVRSMFTDDGSDTRDNIVQNCYCHDNGLPSGGAHDGIFTGFALNFTAQDNICDHNGEHGIYISNSADNPIVRRNVCSNNRASGIQLNADLNTGDGNQDGIISNWLVEGNTIFGNGTSGGAGINLDGDINGICRNNLIYNNLASGIALFQIDGGAPSSNNLIVNNTIYNPNSNRGAILMQDGAGNNTVFNNILISGKGMDIGPGSTFQHDYNIVSSYVGASASAHESSATAAQLFVNAGANDFHLAAASPALNSGVATFNGKNAPANDIENNARPSGAAFDRGSYETVTAPPATQAPQNISVTPAQANSAPGTAITLTALHRDANGFGNFSYVLLNAGPSESTTGALRGYYNAVTNLLYLRNDANTAWLGGFAPGSNNVISNAQGSLNCAQTTVNKQGTDLTVAWRLTPAATWAGKSQKVFIFAQDKDGLSDGWDQLGTWQITSPNNVPQNQNLAPAQASNAPNTTRIFSAVYRDTNGADDLTNVYLRATMSSVTALCVQYDAVSNKLYLLNENSAWIGGFAPGSNNVINTSQGSLNCAQTTLSQNGAYLTVNWNLTAKAPLAGQTYSVDLRCKDSGNLFDGWDALGTWTITD